MAVAGVARMGWEGRLSEVIDVKISLRNNSLKRKCFPPVFSSKCWIHLQMLEAPTCLHAVGQGALAVECRSYTLECVSCAVLGAMMIRDDDRDDEVSDIQV